MRLFKCYDSIAIDSMEQVIAVWAKTEYDALQKCAEIHKNIDCYDDPYETVLRDWKAEEFFLGDGDVFICYPKDFSDENDIRLISVPFHVQDVEFYIKDRLIEIESNETYFRDHVKDKVTNCSFNERFYYDSKGWIFETGLNLNGEVEIREDIKVEILEDNLSISRYLAELWFENVHNYFHDNEDYRDLFIEYITTDAEPDILDDGFFYYVCKKVMESEEWVKYEDIRKVDIVA